MENETKVVVVIGASRGIGCATALALARDGTHLVLAARDAVALDAVALAAGDAGASAEVVPCDVTAEPHVRLLIERAAARTGRIDVLVNSAGGAVVAPFETIALADWESTLRAALTGTFLACKHAVAHMREGALIVNVASVAARQPFPNWAAYSAAKAGVLGFSNAI